MQHNNRSLYQSLMVLFNEIKPYKYALIAAIVGVLLNILATKVGIYKYMLPKIFDEGFIAKNPDFLRQLPYFICIIFPIIGIGEFLAKFYMGYIARSIVCNYRKTMLQHILYMPIAVLQQQTSSSLIAKVNYESEQVALAVSDSVKQLLSSIVAIIAAFGVMLSLSVKVTIFVAFILTPLSLLLSFANKKIRRYTVAIQQSISDLTLVASEIIQGNKVIKIYNGYHREQTRIAAVANLNRKHEITCEFITAVSSPIIQIIGAIAIVVFLMLQFKGYINLKPGEMLGFFGAMFSLLRPTKTLANINGVIQKGLTAIISIKKLLNEATEDLNLGIFVPKLYGDIKLQNLSFTYNNNSNDNNNNNIKILHNVNLNIKIGQTVAIVGPSGGGKSSLISLLLGFYQPTGGEILFDGHSSQAMNLNSLRRNIAVVSQDIFLFNGTIAENIAYGQEDVEMTRIIAAATAAYIHDFIMTLPAQYQTVIGENGATLSGGQRQRLAIARAIIKNAPILLLDEATSALDNESENKVQMSLDNLSKGRTTIIVAHRLSTIETADHIVVLQEGRIVEQGTHHELIQLQGRYTSLNTKTFA